MPKGLNHICWRKPGLKVILPSTITPTGAVPTTVTKCVTRRIHHFLLSVFSLLILVVIFNCSLFQPIRAEVELIFPHRPVTFPGLSSQPFSFMSKSFKIILLTEHTVQSNDFHGASCSQYKPQFSQFGPAQKFCSFSQHMQIQLDTRNYFILYP